MSASIDTVIAELIDQRRAKETEIRRIDEALLALQPFTEPKPRRARNVPPEVRQARSEFMKAQWAQAKAEGRPFGRQVAASLPAEQPMESVAS